MKIVCIKLSEVKKNENYRSKVGDVTELMQSIKQNGLLQPIGLTKEGNKYRVVFGNRRFAAIKKLGFKTIDGVLVESDQNETILNVVENLHRDDVSLYEVGRAINMLITKEKLTQSEVTARLGTNKSYIKKALDAFKVTPPVFRSKVVSMDLTGRSKGKGLISSSVSSTINSTASRFNLTKKQIHTFYTAAAETEMSYPQVRTVCSLMNEGLTITNALKAANKVKTFRAEIIIRKDEDKRLTAKYGKSYISKLINAQKVDRIKSISKIIKS